MYLVKNRNFEKKKIKSILYNDQVRTKLGIVEKVHDRIKKYLR